MERQDFIDRAAIAYLAGCAAGGGVTGHTPSFALDAAEALWAEREKRRGAFEAEQEKAQRAEQERIKREWRTDGFGLFKRCEGDLCGFVDLVGGRWCWEVRRGAVVLASGDVVGVVEDPALTGQKAADEAMARLSRAEG